MEIVNLAREYIVKFYKRSEPVCVFIVRLLIGMAVYNALFSIGSPRQEVSFLFNFRLPLPLTFVLAVSFAIFPVNLSYGIITVLIGLMLSAHLEVAVVVTLSLACIIFFYARFAPKESILMLAPIGAFHVNVPYIVPIIAGLYFSVGSVVPIAIGIFITNYIPVVNTLLKTAPTAGLSIMEMPASYAGVLELLKASLASNQEWIFTSFIFAMVVITVYAISKLSIDYSRDIAIGMGSLLTVISFVIAAVVVRFEQNIMAVVIGVLISAAAAEFLRLFDAALDYRKAERVEFEDDENYYYVRVIPKIILSKRKKQAKRAQPEPVVPEEAEEEIEEEDYEEREYPGRRRR